MFFSFKNIIKLLLVSAVFGFFFYFIFFLYNLNNQNYLKQIDVIPIIEADKPPFRSDYIGKNDASEAYEKSCTLNNEC